MTSFQQELIARRNQLLQEENERLSPKVEQFLATVKVPVEKLKEEFLKSITSTTRGVEKSFETEFTDDLRDFHKVESKEMKRICKEIHDAFPGVLLETSFRSMKRSKYSVHDPPSKIVFTLRYML